jgi:hypothetical protein
MVPATLNSVLRCGARLGVAFLLATASFGCTKPSTPGGAEAAAPATKAAPAAPSGVAAAQPAGAPAKAAPTPPMKSQNFVISDYSVSVPGAGAGAGAGAARPAPPVAPGAVKAVVAPPRAGAPTPAPAPGKAAAPAPAKAAVPAPPAK